MDYKCTKHITFIHSTCTNMTIRANYFSPRYKLVLQAGQFYANSTIIFLAGTAKLLVYGIDQLLLKANIISARRTCYKIAFHLSLRKRLLMNILYLISREGTSLCDECLS